MSPGQSTNPQFYVDDVYLDGQTEIPVDNFYWMTSQGLKIRLVMHAGQVFLEIGEETCPCVDIPDGLVSMAAAIANTDPDDWKRRLYEGE